MGTCMSPSTKYESRTNYSEECCLAKGTYSLECKCSFGDGWHGGYLEIDEKKYCGKDDFKEGHSKTVQVTFGQA